MPNSPSRDVKVGGMARIALVVGASGIVGAATAARLASEGWTVHGLARHPGDTDGVRPVAADLQEPAGLEPVRLLSKRSFDLSL